MDSMADAINKLKSTIEDLLWAPASATGSGPTGPGSSSSSSSSGDPSSAFPPHLKASNNRHIHTAGTDGFLSAILSREGLLDAYNHFRKDTQSFVRAVDWTEPFIFALVGFHVLFFFWILANRNETNTTMWNLVTLAVLALSSEFVNDRASQHHALFSKTNYFDRNGVFITTMFSVPLLLLMMLTVILLLIQLSRTMVKAKRLQLQQQTKPAASGTAAKPAKAAK